MRKIEILQRDDEDVDHKEAIESDEFLNCYRPLNIDD